MELGHWRALVFWGILVRRPHRKVGELEILC